MAVISCGKYKNTAVIKVACRHNDNIAARFLITAKYTYFCLSIKLTLERL
jgi:hypothetical protein